MPTSDSASTSRRLLALLSLLQRPRDWPAPELARRLGVSERTVRRDVDRLRELDYLVEATRGPDGGYRLGAGSVLPPLLLDDEQAVAMAIALRAAASAGVDIDEAADRALQTLARLMPNRLAERIAGLASAASSRPDPTRGALADREVLLRIGDAIRAHRELRFDYTTPGADELADPVPRRIEPHHLILSRGRWYLIGWSADHDDWRIYRADRMRLRSHTGREFAPREVPGGDAAAFLVARFTGSTGAPGWACWGEATMALPVRDVLPYIGDGAVEQLEPNRTRVRLGAWSWAAVSATLLRFDAELTHVEPRDLRDAFRELAARAGRAGEAGYRVV